MRAGPVGLMMAAELRRHGVLCRIIAPGSASATVEGLPVVQDAAGEFQRLYDVAAMSAYLVRPDGYIGYRADPLRLDRLETCLRRIFGQRSP